MNMERKPGVAGGSKWTYEATFHIAMKGVREYYTTAAKVFRSKVLRSKVLRSKVLKSKVFINKVFVSKVIIKVCHGVVSPYKPF
jgi:hypothetical protein